jgi:glycine dehydrogenase subunit 2
MTADAHFHAAAWHEPLVTELGSPGERGILVPGFDDGPEGELPPDVRRTNPPALPELGQPQVLRHFTRLSQMSLGHNVVADMTAATTTPKYPPVVNELITRSPKLAELHPDQPDECLQGVLRLLYELGGCLQALSGMDACSLQGFGGAHAIFGGVLVIRAYHASRGDAHRDEIISEFASHPTNPSTAASAGFKVIEVAPGPRGYAELDAVKAAVSERTAGLLLNNPEDTGIFNPEIDRIAEVVHDAGGLCGFDQANANATLGISRARDCGFDLAHFNLHKTFGAPISLYGPAVGAICVRADLARFLPVPVIVREGDTYRRDYDRPETVGRIAGYLGNVPALVKAYAWIRAIGPERIADVARYAVLNNNYLQRRLDRIPGITTAFPDNADRRLDVVRFSLGELKEETGIGTEDVRNRITDYGLPGHWMSHHPVTSPEPFTLEPTESASRRELDEVAAIYERVVAEARSEPETVRTAPHRGPVAAWRADAWEGGWPPAATARLIRRPES